MPIEFDAAGHTYRLHGAVVPSVTQILDDLGLSPEYPDRPIYRARGTAVHGACALLVKARSMGRTLTGMDLRIRGYISSFGDWLDRSQFAPELIERAVWSDKWRVAGTLDYFGLLQGAATIVDLKSGEPADAACLQTAAYAELLKESHGLTAARRMTLRLHADGSRAVEDEHLDWSNDIRYFLSAASLWHWRAKRGLIR